MCLASNLDDPRDLTLDDLRDAHLHHLVNDPLARYLDDLFEHGLHGDLHALHLDPLDGHLLHDLHDAIDDLLSTADVARDSKVIRAFVVWDVPVHQGGVEVGVV